MVSGLTTDMASAMRDARPSLDQLRTCGVGPRQLSLCKVDPAQDQQSRSGADAFVKLLKMHASQRHESSALNGCMTATKTGVIRPECTFWKGGVNSSFCWSRTFVAWLDHWGNERQWREQIHGTAKPSRRSAHGAQPEDMEIRAQRVNATFLSSS